MRFSGSSFPLSLRQWLGQAPAFSAAHLQVSRAVRVGICTAMIAWIVAVNAAADEFVQPDGTVIRLASVKVGDAEFFQDEAGFTVVRVPPRYEYAVPSAIGGLQPSGIALGVLDPTKSSLPKHLAPTPEFMRAQRDKRPALPAPRSPLPVEVKLSDGSVLSLTLKGSGAFLWYEDQHGYAIVERPARFEYALRGPSGELVPRGILAGSMNPQQAGLTPEIRPAQAGP